MLAGSDLVLVDAAAFEDHRFEILLVDATYVDQISEDTGEHRLGGAFSPAFLGGEIVNEVFHWRSFAGYGVKKFRRSLRRFRVLASDLRCLRSSEERRVGKEWVGTCRA